LRSFVSSSFAQGFGGQVVLRKKSPSGDGFFLLSQQVELFGVGLLFATVLGGEHGVGLGDGCGDVFFGTLLRLLLRAKLRLCIFADLRS